MKSNIDLTSNEIFSRKISFTELTKYFYDRFPWNIKYSETVKRESDLAERFEFIYTGDKKCRKKKKDCESVINNEYCDCCGVYIAKMPWNRTNRLCEQCNDELYKENKNIPWKMKTSMNLNLDLLSLL